jgi:hypothetical protein
MTPRRTRCLTLPALAAAQQTGEKTWTARLDLFPQGQTPIAAGLHDALDVRVAAAGSVSLWQQEHVIAQCWKQTAAQWATICRRLAVAGVAHHVPASLVEVLHCPRLV